MKVGELVSKLETMKDKWGDISVYFDSGDDGVKRVDNIHVGIIPVEHDYVLVMDEFKSTEEIKKERERLMDGLEKCSGIRTNDQDVCQGCPYFKDPDCTGKLAKDALARIRELEMK